jgi:hypothetical protein
VNFGHIMGHTVGNAIVHGTVAFAVLAATTGCDIVQGFQNAGDALFPPQKTYLETPGFRLATGGFRRLNVGVGDELYLLARNAEDPEPALYSMRFVDPKPCKIAGVGRYWASGIPTEYPSQIAYLEGDVRRGRLHFVDARCNVHEDLVFEDAELPLNESVLGLLVFAGPDLLLIDPPKNEVRTLASGVQALFLNGPGAHLVMVDGKLRAYDTATWTRIGREVGESIVGVRGVGSAFLFEDATGIHGLSVIATLGDPQITVTDIDPEGCRLGYVSGSVIAYYSPCAEQTLTLWNASNGEKTRPDFVADPALFAIERDPDSTAQNPTIEEDYFYYTLRELTGDGGGTLVVRSPAGDEFTIGPGARLDRTNLDDSGDFGLALLDVSGETGRLVRWDREGTVETLATGVLYGSGDLIVNWNGAVGDRARITDDGELEIFLEGVPRRDYEYVDVSRRWHAVFDESDDGITGTLSIDSSNSRTFANKRVIARGVRHPRHQFLDVVLPGIAYVSNYDFVSDTGRLEYNNLELGFRGIVSEGVSDFIPAGNGILYTVPFGSARGVWLARAQ